MTINLGEFTAGEKPAPLVYQFQKADGTPLDLSASYVARVTYRERFGTPTLVSTGVTVTSGVNGEVTYVWTGAELASPGHYYLEVWAGNGTNRFASELIEYDVRAAVGVVPVI